MNLIPRRLLRQVYAAIKMAIERTQGPFQTELWLSENRIRSVSVRGYCSFDVITADFTGDVSLWYLDWFRVSGGGKSYLLQGPAPAA